MLRSYEATLKARKVFQDRALICNPSATLPALAGEVADLVADAESVLSGLDPDASDDTIMLKLWALEPMVRRLSELSLTLSEAVKTELS